MSRSESKLKSESRKVNSSLERQRKSRKTRWGQSACVSGFETKVDASKSVSEQNDAPKVKEIQKENEPIKDNNVSMSSEAAKAAIEKAKQALALQKQVQEQMKNLKAAAASRASSQSNPVAAVVRLLPSAKPLRFDRLGREIDAEGKVLDVKPIARSTLKVNINKERERKLKQATVNTRIDRTLTNPALNKWFDSSLPANSKLRRKGLSFVEKGYYADKEKMLQTRELTKTLGYKLLTPESKKEQKLRDAATQLIFDKIKSLHSDNGEQVDEADVIMDDSINPNHMALGEKAPKQLEEEEQKLEDRSTYRQEALHSLQRRQVGIIPDVEWWDQPLLKKISDDEENVNQDFPYIINESIINDYVEHPVPIEPVVDLAKPVPPTLYLTAKEQEKLRRRKRQEKERDKRDKIRMGLIPPPPPTVRLSNLARVLGKEAAAEPSRIEKEVLKQVEKRKKDHEERNKARKLDAEAKRKNTINKWTKMPHESDVPAGGAEVRLFAVSSLTSSAHLFKVDKNAQQYHVTGACILCPQIGNMIVVEGSSKALKKYTNLLLRRIKWHITTDGTSAKPFEDVINDPQANLEDNSAYCRLLWQGVVKTRSFKQWKIYPCKSESEIKKVLIDRNSDFYWDMFQKLHIFEKHSL